MKSIIYTIALLMLVLVTKGQTSNIIIYAESGEKFSVMLNGKMETDSPVSNIELNYLTPNKYSLLVTMEANGQKVDKSIYLEEDRVYTYSIIDKSKTKMAKGLKHINSFLEQDSNIVKQPSEADYTIRLSSQRDLPSAPMVSNPNQNVKTRIATPQSNQNSTTQTTTINANENSMSATISINTSDNFSAFAEVSESNSTEAENDGIEGCAYAMAPLDFKTVLESINSKSFEDSKLQLAKQVAESNCLKAIQIKKIMQSLTFEDSKLEFAKYAYPFSFDKGNYFMVNDAFEFELTIEELQEFINKSN